MVNTICLASSAPKKPASFSLVSYTVLAAPRDASLTPLPAFPIEHITAVIASITSCGLRIVVAALSKYIILILFSFPHMCIRIEILYNPDQMLCCCRQLIVFIVYKVQITTAFILL